MSEDLLSTFCDEVPKSLLAEACQSVPLLRGKRFVSNETIDLRCPIPGDETVSLCANNGETLLPG